MRCRPKRERRRNVHDEFEGALFAARQQEDAFTAPLQPLLLFENFCWHTPAMTHMRRTMQSSALLLILATSVRGMRQLASSPTLQLLRKASIASEMNACCSGNNDGDPKKSSRSLAALQQQRLVLERLTSKAGISERERWRFSYLIKTHEPIPQEIVGLQAVCGFIGVHYSGFCGLLIGVLQAGPLFSILPGRSGNFLRGTGWHVYSVVAAVVKRLSALACELRRWCDATGTSKATSVALHSSRRLLESPVRATMRAVQAARNVQTEDDNLPT